MNFNYFLISSISDYDLTDVTLRCEEVCSEGCE